MTFTRVNPAVSSLSLVALLAFGSHAFAADISLSNVKVANATGKGTAILAKVDVTGTNLSTDELMKLFSATTPKQERAQIAAKMRADNISIPDIVVTRSDKPGQINFKGFSVTGVNAGKFAQWKLDSFNGKVPEGKSGGDVTFSSGALVVTDGNLSSALSALKSGDVTDGTWQFGKFSWVNFQATFPEKTNAGPVYHTAKVGSVNGETKYNGTIPTTTTVEFKDMIFMPAANSQAGQGLAMFGYKQVNLGMTMAGVYDVNAKNYKLSEFALKGTDTGVLKLSGSFGNIDAAAFNGDKRQRVLSLMKGDVDDVKLSFVNNGLMDKAIAFYGRMKGAKPDAVKQEWAGMVGGMLPMVLGGDAGAMQTASAVGDFIKVPKNIVVTVNGKTGPLPFSEFIAVKNPMQLISKLKIEAAANK